MHSPASGRSFPRWRYTPRCRVRPRPCTRLAPPAPLRSQAHSAPTVPPADPGPREGRCRAPRSPAGTSRALSPAVASGVVAPTGQRSLGRRRAGRCLALRRTPESRGHRESGLEPAEERPSPPPPTPPTLACCGSAAAPTARAAGRQHRSQESRWRRREGGLEPGGTPPYRPAAASVTLGRRGPAVCSWAGRRGLPGSAPGGGAEASSPRRQPARVCAQFRHPRGQKLPPGVLHWAPRGRPNKFAHTPRGSEQ